MSSLSASAFSGATGMAGIRPVHSMEEMVFSTG